MKLTTLLRLGTLALVCSFFTLASAQAPAPRPITVDDQF